MSKRRLREEIAAPPIRKVRQRTYCKHCGKEINGKTYVEPLCGDCRKERRNRRLRLLKRRETEL